MKNFLWLILGSLLIVGAAGCDAELTPSAIITTPTDTTTADVTFTGTLQAPAAPAGGLARPGNYVLDPTQFTLYCVTFTNPPQSDTGSFDASGNFSVTVADAAGVPVGCFITNATTNVSVATLTFTVGTASEFDDGTSGAATLAGGSYAISINFDPESGVASADITTVVATSGVEAAATFDPASLVGEWNMTCSANNTADVQAFCANNFLEGAASLPLYLDVISATVAGQQRYGMGVWDGTAAFVVAGATEGVGPTLPAEVTSIVSLNADVAGATAQGTFAGFFAAAGATFDRPTATMTGPDVLTALAAMGLPYDAAYDDAAGNSCTNATLNLAQEQDRDCLLQFIWDTQETSTNALAKTLPRPDNRAWREFAHLGPDANGNPLVFDPAVHKVKFGTTKIAHTPNIQGRFALMDLEVSGATAIARHFEREAWTERDFALNLDVQCENTFELAINMIPVSAAAMDGWFTFGEYRNCRRDSNGNLIRNANGDLIPESSYGTFLVNFAK